MSEKRRYLSGRSANNRHFLDEKAIARYCFSELNVSSACASPGRRATDPFTVRGRNDSEMAPQVPGIAQNGLGNSDEPRSSRCGKPCSANSASQPRARKLLERAGAMRQGERAVSGNAMLLLRPHLTEGAVMAVRPKDRIVAKSSRPSRREDKGPIHATLESFVCAVRPCQRQGADEGRPPGRGSRARPEFALDASHAGAKVFG